MNRLPRLLAAWIAAFLWLGFTLLSVESTQAEPVQTIQDQSWIQLNGPTVPGGRVLDLAISASDPNVLFTLIEGQYGQRLFQSQDSGLHWQQVYTNSLDLIDLEIDPEDPASLFASSDSGLFHSADSGLSWTEIYTLGQVFAAGSASLLYAGGRLESPEFGCFGTGSGVAHSWDGGETWQISSLGCWLDLAVIAAEPGDPLTVYAGGMSYQEKRPMLFRSVDGGVEWESIWPPDHPDLGQFISLVIDPLTPDRIYVSTTYRVSFSPDGGDTWQPCPMLPDGPYMLAVGGGVLYASRYYESTNFQIYRSDDGGLTWWRSLGSLPDRVVAMQVAPDPAHRLFAGLENFGVWRSLNQGGDWQEMNDGIRSSPGITSIVADPTQAGGLLVGSAGKRGGVFYSEDGLGWTTLLTDTSVWSAVIHPVEPVTIFAGGTDGLYQIRGGRIGKVFLNDLTWQITLSHHPQPWVLVSGFAGKYFVATYRPNPAVTYWVWNQYFFPASSVVMAVAGDPFDLDTIYASGAVGGNGAIWRSQDGGESFQMLSQGVGDWVDVLLVDRFRPGTIYAASDRGGVYISADGGTTWADMNAGLLGVDPDYRSLVMDELGQIYVLSYEQGVFRWNPMLEAWEFIGQPEEHLISLMVRSAPSPSLFAGGRYSLWQLELPPVKNFWFPLINR